MEQDSSSEEMNPVLSEVNVEQGGFHGQISTERSRGSTVCPSCSSKYNNNAIPAICASKDCDYPLG